MEKIEFFNRDRSEVWLERTGEETEWWKLRIEPPQLYRYIRLLFEDDGNEIYAVDPPGGPFISIGSKVGLKELEVREIKNTSMGIFLKLRP